MAVAVRTLFSRIYTLNNIVYLLAQISLNCLPRLAGQSRSRAREVYSETSAGQTTLDLRHLWQAALRGRCSHTRQLRLRCLSHHHRASQSRESLATSLLKRHPAVSDRATLTLEPLLYSPAPFGAGLPNFGTSASNSPPPGCVGRLIKTCPRLTVAVLVRLSLWTCLRT